MSQSSIEYLVNIVQSCIPPNYIPIEIIQQAKEMHKEEIEEAYCKGVDDEYEFHINNETRYHSQIYYNETFGGNND